jgi:hypothetical protein
MQKFFAKNGKSCQERSSGVKGNNVSKIIRCHSYVLYFKTVVIKHTEQTTKKQKKN